MRSLRVICALVVSVPPAMALAALPSESEIPGEARTDAVLPSESMLPPYAASLAAAEGVGGVDGVQAEAPPDGTGPAIVNAALPPESEPTESGEPDAAPPQELPSEQAIPTAPGPAPDVAAANDLPLKGSPDGIPWLRLNVRGHTAPLRALAFSDNGERICTAGEDKTLVVWTAAADAGRARPRWGYERTVRWQIQRGTRGRIYALAATPNDVALAGEGAMGGAGEVLLIDPTSGELSATLNDLDNGHRQVVVALSFAPTADDALASLSMDGVLVQWRTTPAGLWRATRLSAPDAEVYGNDPTLIRRLAAGRTVSAVAAVDDRYVVAPMYSRMENSRVVWRLEQYDRSTGGHRPLGNEQQAPHWDRVQAVAVSGDGSRMASADGGGYVYLWDLGSTPARVSVIARTQAWSLAFDREGDRLVIGSDVDARTGRASVDVWNVGTFDGPERIAHFESNELVAACGASPDGGLVAWTAGARAFVQPVDGGAAQELRAGALPPLRIAFPADPPHYRLGIAKPVAGAAGGAITHSFDTDLLRLDRVNQPQAGKWLPADWLSQNWTVREEGREAGLRSIWLYQAGARRARLPLTEERHGRLTASCWIPTRDAAAPPLAAAVGTSGGSIYLVRPAAQGEAPIVRQLRGHTSAITSLAVSVDLRYLASTSLDGVVCVWPLANLGGDGTLVQRWGSAFVQREGGVFVDAIRADGPAFFRGMRNGDQLLELRYVDAGKERIVNTPVEILAALGECPWESLVTFKFARGRAAPTEFQIYPAWQQLVTLFLADNGEWAYWSPAGYYDASFEGHKLFGWQINRGLEMLPDFFLAAQFRRQLERPRVMSQLLRRGSLDAAFRAARVEPPAQAEDAIVNSYRLKPEVTILSPRDGDAVSGAAKLVARLSVDVAERLAPPKAFANGVVAVERRLVEESEADGRRCSTFEWALRLPSDPRVMLQVAAATENEVTAGASVVVANEAPRPKTPPRLFLASVGVDQYRDAQIPKLSTAVKSTEDLLGLLAQRTANLYDMDAVSLADDRATKPSWRFLTEELSARLASDVSPDDLVIVFLAGHGFQAPDDGGYQFVTADVRYADVMSGRFGDCLAISDLAFLADVPCRKLVILNTCHGGVTPLQHRELKSAVRALQGDMMLTLAASGGEQEAVEGRFAKRLLEALNGAGDADGNGLVSFDETVAYVERTVTADSSGDAVRQTPSAGPKELLPYAALPLTLGDQALVSVGSP